MQRQDDACSGAFAREFGVSDDFSVPEQPFNRAWRTWETWSSADTWTRVVADARRKGRDLSALGDLEELTSGPDPLTALRANCEVVQTMTRWQWEAMRAAREQGYGWHEIGQVLGLDAEGARGAYLTAVDEHELAADRMSDLGPQLRYDPRWRALADDNDADRER
jgi:hypothetical protein